MMKTTLKRILSAALCLVMALGLLAAPAASAVSVSYDHDFTASGKASEFYTITGNLSTKKDVTSSYDGKTLTQCLKMESSTAIEFTAPSAGKLTLVFATGESASIKVDNGSKQTASGNILTLDITAGFHTLTKANSGNLFYMSFSGEVKEHSHTFSNYVVTKAATCTEKGSETAPCDVAGCTETNTRDIDALGHLYKNGVDGICQRCGIDSATGEVHSHTWGDDGVCTNTRCGAIKPEGEITKQGGDLETAYIQWSFVPEVDFYKVYVKKVGGQYEELDNELVRQYPSYMRADALGLAAGSYQMKVECLLRGEMLTTMESGTITVYAHDRSGFAHMNGHVPGAYNMDGTLKSGAQVIYVTNDTKDTVEFNGQTGIQAILTSLKKYNNPVAVRFIGNITDPKELEKGDLLLKEVTCGVTFEGVGNDATINGFGITPKYCFDVEVRNLGFMNCNSNEGDSLSFDGAKSGQYLWSHNNDIFYGDAGTDSDQAKGDGALDTKNSLYVTHSYNHFWDSGKSNLVGMHEGEKNLNWITFHHNWYDHSDSRHPRVRGASVHVYNNYFDGIAKYGVGATEAANIFVENNYFRNTTKPMMISMQGTDAKGDGTFSGEDGGMIKSYGNKFDNTTRTLTYITYQQNATDFDAYEASSRNEQVPASVKTKQGGNSYNNFDTDPSQMYDYTPDTPDVARDNVIKWAGRVEGGDFQWDFGTGKEVDEFYGVDVAFKTALTKYTGTLVSVGGAVEPVTGSDSAHTAHDWSWTVTREATCVEPGERTGTCSVGGETKTEVIPATGIHKYDEDGVCSVCGDRQQTTDEPDVEFRGILDGERDLYYSYWENETLQIAEMEEGDVVWSATYDEDGRLTGIQFLIPAAGTNTATVKIDSKAAKLKLFWLDQSKKAPLSQAVAIWGEVEDDIEE